MIAILDIGIGNIESVAKALKYLGAEFKVVKEKSSLLEASKIIFPGVGSFATASQKLTRTGMKDVIRDQVLRNKVPFLGICLGMQLISASSEEGGHSDGLDLIDSEIVRISDNGQIKIPHMGWNDVQHDGSGLFDGIENNPDFYFVHSFRMIVHDQAARYYCTTYGEKIVAYVQKDNIYGTQFHPEKSQSIGLSLLKNFSDLC